MKLQDIKPPDVSNTWSHLRNESLTTLKYDLQQAIDTVKYASKRMKYFQSKAEDMQHAYNEYKYRTDLKRFISIGDIFLTVPQQHQDEALELRREYTQSFTDYKKAKQQQDILTILIRERKVSSQPSSQISQASVPVRIIVGKHSILNPYYKGDLLTYAGSPDQYSWYKQLQTYNKLSTALARNGLKLTTVYSGTFSKNNRMWTTFAAIVQGKQFVWYKYESGHSMGGQNNIYINHTKFQTSKFLKRSPELQDAMLKNILPIQKINEAVKKTLSYAEHKDMLGQELEEINSILDYTEKRLIHFQNDARTFKQIIGDKNSWEHKSLNRVVIAKEHLYLTAAEHEQYKQEIAEINDQYNKTSKYYLKMLKRQKEIIEYLSIVYREKIDQ